MPPLSVLIKPASSSCNMRCKYCFYADVAKHRALKNAGVMQEETQENLIKKAFAYADGYITFAFQGGEPTLAGLDYFRRHIELCKKYAKSGVEVYHSLQTNGYVIDEEWAKFFAENRFLVGISLDGPKDVHDGYRKDISGEGTFNRVRNAVNLFNRYHVEYNMLCVVTRQTAQNANKVLNFFINGGFSYLQFIPCLNDFEGDGGDWSLSAEEYGEFLIKSFNKFYACHLKKKFLSIRNFDNYISMLAGYPPESCGMSGVCTAYFVVEGNGNVYPCDFYVLDRYLGGNVNEDSFSKIRESENFRRFVKESLPVDTECKACRWYALCRGGCRRYREPFENGVPRLNILCKSYKMFFESCYKDLEKMTKDVLEREKA